MMKAVQQKIISPKPSLQKNVNSNIYNYLLYTPHNFQSRKWPLIIFLHGAGEMAKVPNSLEKVKKNGIPKVSILYILKMIYFNIPFYYFIISS